MGPDNILVLQSCPTLCNPMNCSLPGSSVHEILQARILEWAAVSFSRGSSQPRDWTLVSCIAGRFFTTKPSRKPKKHSVSPYNMPLASTPLGVVVVGGGWDSQLAPSQMLVTDMRSSEENVLCAHLRRTGPLIQLNHTQGKVRGKQAPKAISTLVNSDGSEWRPTQNSLIQQSSRTSPWAFPRGRL